MLAGGSGVASACASAAAPPSSIAPPSGRASRASRPAASAATAISGWAPSGSAATCGGSCPSLTQWVRWSCQTYRDSVETCTHSASASTSAVSGTSARPKRSRSRYVAGLRLLRQTPSGPIRR